MSIFNKLTTLGRGSSAKIGGHALRDSSVMAPTTPGAINPMNPGAMAHARSVPIIRQPRYFKPGEDQALQEFAYAKRQQLAASRRAYKALESVEHSDAELTATHRQYEATVADGELHKKAADVKYARHLHHQRPQYAMLNQAVATARVEAGSTIGRYMATVQQLAGA